VSSQLSTVIMSAEDRLPVPSKTMRISSGIASLDDIWAAV